jgi:hypothetical protein
MDADLAYYRRRSVEETAAAAAALLPRVRQVHLELAHGYDQRIAALEVEQRQTHLHLVTAA